MEILEFIIKHQKPTVSLSELQKYEAIRKQIEEGIEEDNSRTPIGFKTTKWQTYERHNIWPAFIEDFILLYGLWWWHW